MSEAIQKIIGTVFEGEHHQDAIHIAVVPVIADSVIAAGDRIGFSDDHTFRVTRIYKKCVGVADPFLTELVNEGEQFLMFLLPNTTIGLRHEYSHPDIDHRKNVPSPAVARLKNFAQYLGVSYDELIYHAGMYQQRGDYWSQGSRFEDVSLYDQFWEDWQAVTGKTARDEGQFFSCSC